DNYDSFTYNLYQLLSVLGAEVKVVRNDQTTVREVLDLRPAGVVISPGPGGPMDAGISCEILTRASEHIPVLGVCLGHQCIGAAFGGRVIRAGEIMHGKTSLVYHRNQGLFAGLPIPFEAVRYHSLTIERESIPACLEVTAETVDGTIMGLRHRELNVQGVQFHPESVLTRDGPALLRNFLDACQEGRLRAYAPPRGRPQSHTT
ncbi:MAG: aminodeoxychorismate/anthranilate synthase component II, partial [Chloroflexota bacterium]|nr:aminodeoxychorismate/anthranilate synthase component II [Chloroflexota bacterium]